RRQDGDAHAAEDRWNLVLRDIDPASRTGDAHQAGDHLLVAGPVLEVHAQRALLLVLDDPVVLDEPFFLEELGDPDLQLGGRDVHLLVLGAVRVANAGQEVGDRIAHHRDGSYQLALITPGTSPLSASSRKQIRHSWNFLR